MNAAVFTECPSKSDNLLQSQIAWGIQHLRDTSLRNTKTRSKVGLSDTSTLESRADVRDEIESLALLPLPML